MNLKSIREVRNLKNKKVLVRVDFNVPRDANGNVKDDTRIRAVLPTIEFLKNQEAKIILISHLGRPKGEIQEKLRLDKVANYFSKNFYPIHKSPESIGPETEKLIKNLKAGEILLLENIRFHQEEKKCDQNFSKKLAELGEIFVMDAFGAAHRKHSSTAGINEFIPSYAGLLLEKEIENLSPLVNEKIEKPLTMIFGGAKIDTKIGVIENFLEKADNFLIGGALANTFLAAEGFEVGKSFYQKDQIPLARKIIKKIKKLNKIIVIPTDVVIADPDGSEINDNVPILNLNRTDITPEMKIFDLGKKTTNKFCKIIQNSKTVIWNGPLGFCELKSFQKSTKTVARFLAKSPIKSIIGGGDTADAIKKFDLNEKDFTHISTGGGACIEFLSGKKLPAIEILKK